MKTLMKIILMIMVIIAIVIVGINITMREYKNNDLKNLSTNLLQIQAKVKNIKDKTIVEQNNNLLIGDSVPQELLEKFNLENNEEIRILTLEHLDMLGLSNIKEDRKYIVNYNSGEVYYVDGFKTKEGETYYKLSEMNTISTDN